MTDPDEIRKSIRKQVQAKLDQHGWTVIAVGAEPERGRPPFAYSIGLEETFGTPEVVMIGFDPNLMQQLIGEMADAMKNRNLKMPEAGGRVPGVIQKFDVLMRPVPEGAVHDLSKIAQDFHASHKARLMQMVLPDAQGHFPGDPNCNPQFVEFQDTSPFEDEPRSRPTLH